MTTLGALERLAILAPAREDTASKVYWEGYLLSVCFIHSASIKILVIGSFPAPFPWEERRGFAVSGRLWLGLQTWPPLRLGKLRFSFRSLWIQLGTPHALWQTSHLRLSRYRSSTMDGVVVQIQKAQPKPLARAVNAAGQSRTTNPCVGRVAVGWNAKIIIILSPFC